MQKLALRVEGQHGSECVSISATLELAFGRASRQIRGVRPDHGGRLELKLTETSTASARYVLTIFTPEAEVSSLVVVQVEGGTLELGPWHATPPPEWLETIARALLRTVWRTRTHDGAWPRRVTRWRPAPKS